MPPFGWAFYKSITNHSDVKAMSNDKKLIETEQLHDFLLQCKYLSAVKKIIKGITHEYNNVFTGLAGQMRIRKRQSEGGFSEKRALLVEDLLRRGIEKTELLYDFSRDVESYKAPLSPERLAVMAIDLLNSVSRRHRFFLHAETDLPKIHAKYREIILMLFYLGENAIDAVDKGGDIRVEIFHRDRESSSPSVRFQMIDNGRGFPGAGKKSMYEPIFPARGEGSVTGIGLYAVQEIVSDHGGIFKIESVPEGGTIALIDLPVIENGEKDDLQLQQLHRSPHLKTLPQKQFFLVVDDEEAMRDMLLSRLQRRDHVVFCVETCKEAVAELSLLADTVTVVLIDVGLRDASGYECARQLRKINENVCIIMMSGMDAESGEMLDFKASFIKKPFSIDQLEQMIGDAKL